MYHIGVCVILFILIVGIHLFLRNEIYCNGIEREKIEGNGDIYYMGRGNDSENISLLLHRTTWLTDSNKRISWWLRILEGSLISLLLIILLIYKCLPSIYDIIMIIVITFAAFFSIQQYYHTHGDVYISAYTRKNLQLIREKLSLSAGEILLPPTNNFTNIKNLH